MVLDPWDERPSLAQHGMAWISPLKTEKGKKTSVFLWLNLEPGTSCQVNHHQSGIHAFDKQINPIRLLVLVDQVLEIFH